MATISRFGIDDLEVFSRVLRQLGEGAGDMRGAAQRITDHLFQNLEGDDGEPACWGVALHKTHLFGALPPDLQAIARQADGSVTDLSPCFVRMAHSGYDAPDDAGSVVRPLTPGAFLDQPIFVQMLLAMGLDREVVIDPQRAQRLGLHHQNLGVYLVQDLASDDGLEVGAREQVRQLGLSSILGIGSALPNGDLFFVFFFSRSSVPERSADLISSLATAAKAALIPFSLDPFGAAVDG